MLNVLVIWDRNSEAPADQIIFLKVTINFDFTESNQFDQTKV